MVAPIVAFAAISAVTAVAGAYTAAKARGANQAELNRIKQMFESIVPPNYDVSVNDPPQYISERLQGASLDMTRLTPEVYRVVGQYNPEAAQYVAEANPQLLQQTATGQEGRQSQIDALREFQKIAKGENPELKARMQEAALNAQGAAQSRTQSTLQDAQRRGTLGGGVQFGAALQQSGDAMAEAGAQSRAAAIEAYRQKLSAVQQSGSMGRELAQDELGQQKSNADIINSFNERTSKNYQDYLNQRAQLGNQAQMYNLQTEQGAADKNTASSNEMNRYNQQNQNDLRQQDYGNRVGERNYQDKVSESKANWAASEKNRQNQLKSTAYNDQLQRANGMAGRGAQQIAMNNSNAQDTNAAIGAVGSAAGGYYQNEYNDERENARWDRYMKAMQAGGAYQKTGV